MKKFTATKAGHFYEFYEDEAVEMNKIFPNKVIHIVNGMKTVAFPYHEIYSVQAKCKEEHEIEFDIP